MVSKVLSETTLEYLVDDWVGWRIGHHLGIQIFIKIIIELIFNQTGLYPLYNAKALLLHTPEMQATSSKPCLFGIVLSSNPGAVVSRTENLSCIVGGTQ
jgi:hypothetical protein